MELLTVKELASMLKISKQQVYELSNPRNRAGDEREHPLPAVRIGTSLRFVPTEIEAWVLLHRA